jgi:hypothetical protein
MGLESSTSENEAEVLNITKPCQVSATRERIFMCSWRLRNGPGNVLHQRKLNSLSRTIGRSWPVVLQIAVFFWSLKIDLLPRQTNISSLTSIFGSTDLCEEVFSRMKIIKSRYRNRQADEHLQYCLHLCLSKCKPSFSKLSQHVQYHASTSQGQG